MDIENIYQKLNEFRIRNSELKMFISELELEDDDIEEIKHYLRGTLGLSKQIIHSKTDHLKERAQSYQPIKRRQSQKMLTNKVINFDL